MRAESAADTKADTDIDAITNIELVTKVETGLEPDIGAKTGVHTDTEPKPVGNIGTHTKAAAGFGVAAGAEYAIVAVGMFRTNSENISTVCARERSSARRKRIYNDISEIDQVSL